MTTVLFVCMGNICRSPMAEGAFRALIEGKGEISAFTIDSAGTIGYHAGSSPDERAQATAKKMGIDISGQRSRKVTDSDFVQFDHILVMDRENESDLLARCPAEHAHKINLFLSFAADVPLDEMPDPYYGHAGLFDDCYAAAVDAAEGFYASLK